MGLADENMFGEGYMSLDEPLSLEGGRNSEEASVFGMREHSTGCGQQVGQVTLRHWTTKEQTPMTKPDSLAQRI